jgi:putative cell wall-binding protein
VTLFTVEFCTAASWSEKVEENEKKANQAEQNDMHEKSRYLGDHKGYINKRIEEAAQETDSDKEIEIMNEKVKQLCLQPLSTRLMEQESREYDKSKKTVENENESSLSNKSRKRNGMLSNLMELIWFIE